jgi:hypothetical protein
LLAALVPNGKRNNARHARTKRSLDLRGHENPCTSGLCRGDEFAVPPSKFGLCVLSPPCPKERQERGRGRRPSLAQKRPCNAVPQGGDNHASTALKRGGTVLPRTQGPKSAPGLPHLQKSVKRGWDGFKLSPPSQKKAPAQVVSQERGRPRFLLRPRTAMRWTD